MLSKNNRVSKRCIDCCKILSSEKCVRCKSCANRQLSINFSGKNHPNWKNGISTIKKYCIDCKILLAKNAIYDKTKRCRLCYHKKRSIEILGKNNPSWRGGLSKQGYSFKFNNKLKLLIRRRDNFICKNCGITEKKHKKLYSKALHIHHINYNKKNCKENNLITLCLICNVKANQNRKFWIKKFDNKLKKLELLNVCRY